jgi:osmotically-inducible protein OsmY
VAKEEHPAKKTGVLMFNFFKKTDQQIQQDVLAELAWNPSITANKITVTAKDGVVTLHGSVPHYFEKNSAEEAAQRVGGVRAVADELDVDLLGSYARSDSDIAKAAIDALDWNYSVPDGVRVNVEKGWVTLKGDAEWDYERTAATNAVKPLMGVCGVSNDMVLTTKIQPSDVKKRIEEALKRSAESEGREISVAVSGDKVTLSGNVHSLSEIEDARYAAWGAPGVMKVENNLKLVA